MRGCDGVNLASNTRVSKLFLEFLEEMGITPLFSSFSPYSYAPPCYPPPALPAPQHESVRAGMDAPPAMLDLQP